MGKKNDTAILQQGVAKILYTLCIEFVQTVSAQLSWEYNIVYLDKYQSGFAEQILKSHGIFDCIDYQIAANAPKYEVMAI